MSNHKNALKTAWNEHTGDTIKTGKGSLDKYASGWEGIFGDKKKAKEPPMELGHFVVDDSHLIPMMVEPYSHEYMCPNCVTPWKCNGPHIDE